MNQMLELFKVGASLTLDKSGFDSDIREADAAGKGLSESLSKHMEKAKKVIKGLFTVGAVVAATKAVWNLAKATSDAGDRIDKQSQALGLSRKAYQEWDYILRQSGASIDDMGMAMKTMSAAILENGADTAAGLSKLGLSSAQLANMSPEDQLETLVKAFQQMPEGAEKSRLAMQLFGRNAQSLMPLLNSASGSVDELRNRAHDLGLIMSDEDVDSAVAFGDALDDLNAVWTALKQKFGAQLLPGLTKGLVTLANSLGRISNALTKAFKEGDWKGLFSTITEEISALLPQAIDAISGMILGLFENADKIVDLGISLVNGLVDGVAKAAPTLIAKLPQILSKAWESIKSMGLKLGNVLIDAINAVLGTNIPHIDEIRWPTWPEVQKAANDAWNKIKDEAKKLAGLVFGTKADGSVNWPDWPTVQKKATEAWNAIKEKALTLAGLVFGKKADGSVNWPTWDDVVIAARLAWTKIKNKALQIAREAGALVFGRRQDGSVNWPDWSTVSAKAVEIWNGIKTGALGIAKFFGKVIFGTKSDGEVAWPDWDTVSAKAGEIWEGIKTGALGIAKDFGRLIFGTKADGEVAWPTWDDVVRSARLAWIRIKGKAVEIADSFGKLVFGTTADGEVAWPTWKEVVSAAKTAWEAITAEALNIAEIAGDMIFGRKEDGSVNWPGWTDVAEAAKTAWRDIQTGVGTLAGELGGLFKDIGDAAEIPLLQDIGQFLVDNKDSIVTLLESAGAAIATYWTVKQVEGVIKFFNNLKTLFTAGVGGSKIGLILAGIAAAVVLIVENWDKIEPALQDFSEWFDEKIMTPINDFLDMMKQVFRDIGSFFGIDTSGWFRSEEETETKTSTPEGTRFVSAMDSEQAAALQASRNLYLQNPDAKVVDSETGETLSTLEAYRKNFEAILKGNGYTDEDIGKLWMKAIGPDSDFAQLLNGLANPADLNMGLESTTNGLVAFKNSVADSAEALREFKESIVKNDPHGGGGDHFHASGLNYVPYDGYRALLHRGEAVLNASQSRDWRQGGGAGIDFQALAEAVSGAVAEAVSNIQLNMDGKAVGSAVAGQVSREITRSLMGRRVPAL